MHRRIGCQVEELESRLLPSSQSLVGDGLSATYYKDMNLINPGVTRVDPTVNFNWDTGSPSQAIPATQFSARWTGQIVARYTETYTFITTSDDGVALWINNQNVIGHWNDHAATQDTGTFAMVAGQRYDIQMEYYQDAGGSTAKLEWQSNSQAREVVPQSQLFSAAPAAPPAGPGDGLAATYFASMNLTGTSVTRVDPGVNFNWGNGSPAPAMPADHFSVRWTGQVQPAYSGKYTFYTTSDDGIRLWVNNQLLIDHWTDHAPTVDSGTISLVAGQKYDIRMEYYENQYGAEARLEWSSASQARQVIPKGLLFSGLVPPAPQAIAVDAGGGPAGSYVADTYYTGGNTYSTTDSINTIGVSNPASQAVYQSERFGNFTYSISNLSAGASYSVRLHFAEINWNSAGQRLFNVSINGTQVLSNFDIFAQAGGKDIALVETFTATANSSGQIIIAFAGAAGSPDPNAKVSGIEVSPASSTPVTSFAVDAGGPAVGAYLADTSFSGGSVYATTDAINTASVNNPAPQQAYQTERYGNFSYTVSNLTAGGSFTVRLHFAEIYWGSAGQRLFNVSINGVQDLSGFDIFAQAGGKDRAIVQQFTATADTSGKITIAFAAAAGSPDQNAKVSAIEFVSSSSTATPPAAPSSVTATAGNSQVSLAWAASAGASTYNVYRGTAAGGEGATPVQTGLTATSFIDTGRSNGTAYFYRVTAIGAGGESVQSAEVSATPVAPATGVTYYVSPSGNDANDGLSVGTAWQTVGKVNAARFQPGDQILFARGGEWHESLQASSSGLAGKPIVYGAYGTGAKPKFWGSDVLDNSAFQSVGGGVFELTSARRIASVLVDHQFLLGVGDVNSVRNQVGTWFWDGSNLWINNGGSDPRSDGRVYTACVRVDAVFSNFQNHLVFTDLVADETADVNDGYCFRVMGSDDVLLQNDEAYHGGRHNFGVINSTEFVGKSLIAAYAMPNIPGGATLYVSFSDASRSGDTSQWIDCTGDHFENPGQGNYQIFYNHGEGLGAVLLQNMVSHGGKLSIGGSSATSPVTVQGGLIQDASLEIFGNNVKVNGMTIQGNGAVDNFGSDNLFQNMQLIGINPQNGGPTGYWTAIVVRAGAMRNTFRFNTIVMDPAAPGFATALALVGKGSQTNWYGNIVQANGRAVKNWGGSLDGTDLAYADYNFYKPGATFTNSADQDTNLIAWQAQGMDTHSLAGDPLFTNALAGDYSLKAASPAIKAAKLSGTLNPGFDIRWNTRPDGACDMGAYQN